MKILIVDDHSLVREGLKAVLSQSDLEAKFVEAADAIGLETELANNPDTDLLLLDIQLPGTNGLDLIPKILATHPQLPIIMLSADHDANTVTRALSLGASGFLPKISLSQVLISAIQLVLAGGVYIPREALQRPVFQPAPAAVPTTAPVTFESLGFTARQVEVFQLLLQGISNKLIGRQMNLAEATVKIHVRAILRALTVSSRSEAIARAVQLGLQASSKDTPPGSI